SLVRAQVEEPNKQKANRRVGFLPSCHRVSATIESRISRPPSHCPLESCGLTDKQQPREASMYPSRIAPLFLPSLACLAMLSGCSTARMDSQWIDRSFHDGLAAGARVFVSCETGDDSLRRLCEDAWAERLRSEGITVIKSYTPGSVAGDAVANAERIERAARDTGAS